MALHDKLCAERKRRGWTTLEMARRLTPHVSDQCPDLDTLQAYVKRWEAGKVGISERYQFAYAAAFETDLDNLPDPTGTLNADDEERLIKAACRPARVDRSVVEALAAILAAQRRTEDVIGSGPLLGPVRAQLDMIEHLVAEARGPLRSDVVNVGGQWAQFYGWLRANTGDLTEGNRHLDRALEWATESADANLVSEVVSFKGHLAWMSGQAGATIGLSAAAVRGDGLYPGQRAISSSQEARGHAMTGDARAAEAKLDEADQQAAAARERLDEAPPWLYYHSPALFELERGLAYRYLGHHDRRYNRRAIKAFGYGLRSLPVEMRGSEWSGEFIYQLGRAHLQAGEREEAGRLAGDLVLLGERLGSERLIRQAEALAPSS